MQDMFYNYDYVIEKPSKKRVCHNPIIPGQFSRVSWLKNIKNDILGIQITETTKSTFYFSILIDNDFTEIDTFLKNNSFFCEFLDTSYEHVLTKQAIEYYPSILKIELEANELRKDNYYIKFYSVEKPAEIEEPIEEPEPINPDITVCPNPGNIPGEPSLVEDLIPKPEKEPDNEYKPGIYHYYWWGCNHNPIYLDSETELDLIDDISAEDENSPVPTAEPVILYYDSNTIINIK